MADLSITVNGSPYTVSASPAEIEALAAVMAARNAEISERNADKKENLETPHASEAAYLQFAVQSWADQYPQATADLIAETASRALASWSPATPAPQPDLAAVKAALKSQIDVEAEAARLKYITAGAGQALEYREVAEETARYAATGGAGEYPMLQASVSAGEAPSLAEAAALIAAREQGWAMIGAEIRRLRLAAKMAVSAATTVEQAAAAAEVVWP